MKVGADKRQNREEMERKRSIQMKGGILDIHALWWNTVT